MQVSESNYYRSRSAAEWQLAKSAAHPEARRRHVELAQRYSELAGPCQSEGRTNVTLSGGQLLGSGNV